MPFQIIRNDITKVKADAIVNTANPGVAIGDGVESAIYKAAGQEQLLEARRQIGLLNPGEVGITPAFDLDAKFIIHASGPWWRGGDKNEAVLLRQCYDRSLELAAENGCKSIAFPLLATGTYAFPKKLGIEIAVDAFTTFLEEHEMNIFLVVFGEKSVKISGELGEEVQSFIDNDYVEAALEEEYKHDGRPGALLSSTSWEEDLEEDEPWTQEPEHPVTYGAPHHVSARPNLFARKAEQKAAGLAAPQAQVPAAAAKASALPPDTSVSTFQKSLEEIRKEIQYDSLGNHIQQYINKKGLKNSQVYAAANISKQYFSKLLNDQVKPSKEKVMALALGLRLNLDETIDFMRLAGYAFSPISLTDVVVQRFINEKKYNVIMLDIYLDEHDLDPLSNA